MLTVYMYDSAGKLLLPEIQHRNVRTCTAVALKDILVTPPVITLKHSRTSNLS